VLAAGSGVLDQLSANLRRSASGVIVWSERTVDSKWVAREVSAMVERADKTEGTEFPFRFIVAKLDAQPLPDLLSGNLFIDFSSYPDGPTGAELVRLTSGLEGAGLEPPAVLRVSAYEEDVRKEPSELRGRVNAGDFDGIRERALSDTPAYTTSATLPALAAQLLIAGDRLDDALSVLDRAQSRFRRSVRLRQLRGLALRRKDRIKDALLELEKLRADGHNDPETLGILAAAWTSAWKLSKNPDELERARDLYAQAFERTPTDSYSGINAASKSAMLGETSTAKTLAERVLVLLRSETDRRGGVPSADYWERVTEPEALFLLGEFESSLKLYHAARIAHQTEKGSIRSTWAQLELLLPLSFVPDTVRESFRREFKTVHP
jgi:tetratricopeptide (TPR) repeat protein